MFPYIHIHGSCLPDFLRGVFVSVIAVHNSYDIPPALIHLRSNFTWDTVAWL